MCEHKVKQQAQEEIQASLRGLLHSHWLPDFTWTLYDIPAALSGFSNGEIQLSPGKCSSAHCVLDKSLSGSKSIQKQLHIQYRIICNFKHWRLWETLECSKKALDSVSDDCWLKSAALRLSTLDICLYQNERESRWGIMTGFVGSPSIHPHPGYNAHAWDPPIFKTAHNHTFRTREKFMGNWRESINTRVKSCCTSILLSYSPNHQNIFPDAESISNSNYLCKKGQVSPNPSQPKGLSGNCKDVAVYVQMVRRWENCKYSEHSSCPWLLL